MNMRKVLILILVVQATTLVMAAVLLEFVPGVGAQLAMADSTQHFSLLASTLQPIDSSIEYDAADGFLRTIRESTVNTYTAYVGQLDLPNGATIVGARCFGRDTSPFGIEFSFRLYRYSLYSDPIGSPVTNRGSSGNQPGKVEVGVQAYPNMAMIDNNQYSYGIFLELPTAYSPPTQDLWVLRCVVDTSYSVQLPLVQRDARQ